MQYMFQYPINSTLSPTILTYGRGETNEMTLAPYPAGTDVVFTMVDAFGASGGVTSVYTIQCKSIHLILHKDWTASPC